MLGRKMMRHLWLGTRHTCRVVAPLLLLMLLVATGIMFGLQQRHSHTTSMARESGGTFVAEPQERSSRRVEMSTSFSSKVRNNPLVMRAFKTAIGTNWKSTVRIVNDGRQVALGTIVAEGGWGISKASELPKGEFTCRCFDDRLVSAREILRRDDVDLALIKLDRDDLPVIKWLEEGEPTVGSWLATTDTREIPQAIGVLSVEARRIPAERPVLGVQLAATEGGANVITVVPGSGAEQAGLEVGDVIEKVNEEQFDSRPAVLAAIARYKAGERISLGVRRGDRNITLQARLMDLSQALLDPTEMEVNGRVSPRSSGFESVIQHDTVLAPNQCGGPLVDLQGRAVGINIARAGRVCSYALPANLVRVTVDSMLSDPRAESEKAPIEMAKNEIAVKETSKSGSAKAQSEKLKN